MKKFFKFYVIVWAILLVVYSAVVFMVPTGYRFSGGFWAGYFMALSGFVGQLVCAYYAFRSDKKEHIFMKFPLVSISYFSLLVSVLFASVCIFVPFLPMWLGAVGAVCIFGFSVVSLVKAEAAADIAISTEEKVKTNTLFIKNLSVDAEMLLNKVMGEPAKRDVQKVYETIRYSDPISCMELISVEEQISQKFKEFSIIILSRGEYREVLGELLTLLDERNKKCRLFK